LSEAEGCRSQLSLRRATIADSDFFLALRNDPESVRHSGGVEIDPSSHADWFGAAVVDGAQRLWVAVVEGDDVGYLRLHVQREVGVVSLALAPPLRGSGLGAALLRAVQREVVDDPGISSIVGEVESTNVASLRAFERAGFTASVGPDGRVAVSWRSPGAGPSEADTLA
jgi:RimJ/RimL family protein N-acetyltransferase